MILKPRTLAKSEEPDKMPNNAASHQGLHALLRQNLTSGKKYNIVLEIITCYLSMNTMDDSDLLYQTVNRLVLKG